MKKIIALVLTLVCVLGLAGCKTQKPTDQTEELAGAPLAPVGTDMDLETVSQLEIMSGQTGQKITVKDSDNVQKVMDDIESLNYKKMDAIEEIEFAYRIRFYNENYDELGRIFITEENGHQISYDGYYYLIENDLNIDVDYLEELLKDAPPAEPGDEGNDELPDIDRNILYQSDNVTVTALKTSGDKQYNQREWVELSEVAAYNKNPIIFTGSIAKVSQAVVEYKFMGVDVKDNITILDIKVGDIIYNSPSYEFSETVTVGLPYNDTTYSKGLPIAQTGKSFLMFVYPTDTESSSMELSEYVDLWLSSPNQLLLEEVNGYYIVGSFFSDSLDVSASMKEQIGLTEIEVSEYLASSSEAADTIISASESSFDDPTAIMKIMSERANSDSSSLWNLMSNSYVVEKAVLEDIIRGMANNFSRIVLQWNDNFQAQDYFKYNSGSDNVSESKSIAEDTIEYAATRSFSDYREQMEQDGVIPVMNEHPMYTCSVCYNEDGSIFSITHVWSQRGDAYSNLTITIGYQEVKVIQDCISIEVDENGNIVEPAVTVTDRDGIQIVAKGNENREKTITFQNDTAWYQITGSWGDKYEPMVALLDWVWEHPVDFDMFALEKGSEFTNAKLTDYPDAFADQIPDFEAFGYFLGENYLRLKDGVPHTFEGHFYTGVTPQQVEDDSFFEMDGWTEIHWHVSSAPDYYEVEGSIGDVSVLTKEHIEEALQKNSHFSFMMGDVYVWVDSKNPAEVWKAIESLKQ